MAIENLDSDKGDVYVLKRHLGDRPYLLKPRVNAERHDTDFFYEMGVYDRYPAKKLAYEKRRRKEEDDARRWHEWGVQALEALDDGEKLIPAVRRKIMPVVMRAVYYAGVGGITRPEVCQQSNRDGGKVSGAMTILHAAGIMFPLEGVRR